MNKHFLISILVILLFICTNMLVKQILQESRQNEVLRKIENLSIISDKIEINDIKPKTETTKKEEINLLNLYNVNSDIVAWITIKGTNINYPIMQNEEFYIDKNFYKNDSNYGTPFLASYCNIEKSDNLIIYGHNMKNGTMFANLIKYKNKSFYNSHKFIELYTLANGKTNKNDYLIIYALVTEVYSENGFKYSRFYNAKNEKEYDEYISKCEELELYTTNQTAKYGDKLITLVTCEYSKPNRKNGYCS